MEQEKIKETNRVFNGITENFDPNQIDMLVKKLIAYNNSPAQQSKKYVIDIFENYGNMVLSCPNGEVIKSITIKDFFYNLNNGVEKDAITGFGDFVLEDEEELKVAYKAFITGLKKFNWFENNSIDDGCNVQVAYKDNIIFEGQYSDLKKDFCQDILDLSDSYFNHK